MSVSFSLLNGFLVIRSAIRRSKPGRKFRVRALLTTQSLPLNRATAPQQWLDEDIVRGPMVLGDVLYEFRCHARRSEGKAALDFGFFPAHGVLTRVTERLPGQTRPLQPLGNRVPGRINFRFSTASILAAKNYPISLIRSLTISVHPTKIGCPCQGCRRASSGICDLSMRIRGGVHALRTRASVHTPAHLERAPARCLENAE